MEDFPGSDTPDRNPEDRDPKLLGDIIPAVQDEIERRRAASELEKANLTLLNLTRDAHASADELAAAKQRVMELQEQERHGD